MTFNRWSRTLIDFTKLSLVRAGYHTRPAFLVIGAQKAGTSALWRYLSFHPQTVATTIKEIGFFHQDEVYARGVGWYHFHFPLPHRLGPDQVTYEATPEYLYYRKCAARMCRYDPDLRLIVLLRDPVDRAYSAWYMFPRLFANHRENMLAIAALADGSSREWLHRMLSGEEYPSFEDAATWEMAQIAKPDAASEPSWLRRGIYADQLACLFEHFDRAQVLVLDSQLLRHDTGRVLDEVCHFLHLRQHSWSPDQLKPVGVQQYRQSPSDKTREMLIDFFRPHNRKLFELLGRTFEWQSG